jgi:hypothetical protein
MDNQGQVMITGGSDGSEKGGPALNARCHFPSVAEATVARAVRAAVRRHRRSVIIGPVAAIVMRTAPIVPRVPDLPFMSLLFKARVSARPRARLHPSKVPTVSLPPVSTINM